jgi:hypothetical protein
MRRRANSVFPAWPPRPPATSDARAHQVGSGDILAALHPREEVSNALSSMRAPRRRSAVRSLHSYPLRCVTPPSAWVRSPLGQGRFGAWAQNYPPVLDRVTPLTLPPPLLSLQLVVCIFYILTLSLFFSSRQRDRSPPRHPLLQSDQIWPNRSGEASDLRSTR